MNSKLQIKLIAVPYCDLMNLCCPDQITTYERMLHYIKYIKELYSNQFFIFGNPPPPQKKNQKNLVPCM